MVECGESRLDRFGRRQFLAGAAATGTTLAVQGALGARTAMAQSPASTPITKTTTMATSTSTTTTTAPGTIPNTRTTIVTTRR